MHNLKGDAKKEIDTEIREVEEAIKAKRELINKTEDLLCSNPSLANRCEKMLQRYEAEIAEMEEKIEILKNANRANLKPKLHYVISLINNVVMYINDAPLEVNFKPIGSMFPEKIEFDGYREALWPF